MLPPPRKVVTNDEQEALRLLLETALNALNEAPPANWQLLKPHERMVIRLVAEGHSTERIADLQNQSRHTIHSQRTTISRKLGLSGANCLVRFAERHRTWLLAQPLD